MAQQDDDELLYEQLMLKALLTEEDSVESQQEFSEPTFKSTVQTTSKSSNPISREDATSNDHSATVRTATSQASTAKSTESNQPMEKLKATARFSSAEKQSIDKSGSKTANRMDQIDIDITFSLGNSVLKYHELTNLKPGYLFNLGKTFTAPISIYSHNNLLGTAEIVDIEGSVGIRVISTASISK